jgi:lipoate---protein ligase
MKIFLLTFPLMNIEYFLRFSAGMGSAMTLLIAYTAPSPAHNIAMDEVLLRAVQDGERMSAWRFWSLDRPAVVIGTGGRAAQEADLAACRLAGVPVLRRCSGGGAVLQGPGVFNYSAILDMAAHPAAAAGIRAAYDYVFGIVLQALRGMGVDATFEGTSDLAVCGRKISGNAQSRKSRACLVHGTILMVPDLEAMDRFLPHPPDEPAYRGRRSHRDFITSLAALGVRTSPAELAAAIAASAGLGNAAGVPPSPAIVAETERLVREKYATDEWTFRL